MTKSSVWRKARRNGRNLFRNGLQLTVRRPATRRGLLSGISLTCMAAALLAAPRPAQAACTPAATAGTDVIDCSGGVPVNLDTLGGGDTVSVNGGDIFNAGAAINVFHSSLGSINLFSSANVTTAGFLSDGVYGNLSNVTNPGDLTIDVTGGTIITDGDSAQGIYGHHRGLGELYIVSMATITTSGSDADGIEGFSQNTLNTEALFIDAAGGSINVSGDYAFGIYGEHNGPGALDIASAADISSTGTTSSHAIYGIHYGTGTLSINSSASLSTTGANSNGIEGVMFDGTNAQALTINVTGGSITTLGSDSHGILGDHNGTGEINITSSADISATGTGSIGVDFDNAAVGTDVSITTTGTVTGGYSGIKGVNRGTGALTINTGAITGSSYHGISATGRGTNTSIASTGPISGGASGIYAVGGGSGDLTIDVVDVTGVIDSGITALNNGRNVSLTATGTITGGSWGIYTENKAAARSLST